MQDVNYDWFECFWESFKITATNRPTVNVSLVFLKAMIAVSASITKSVTISLLAFYDEVSLVYRLII